MQTNTDINEVKKAVCLEQILDRRKAAINIANTKEFASNEVALKNSGSILIIIIFL
jgi:hypothetical protein